MIEPFSVDLLMSKRDEASFFYFSFGSNLLKERIRVQIKDAAFFCIGSLRNYELVFYDYGSRWHGAVASIECKEHSEVWGCVWSVSNSFAEELDLQECGYHRLEVNVETKKGVITCRTYQYSNPIRKRQLPSPHYKLVIVSGAEENGLPEEYIAQLKKIPHNGYSGSIELNLEVLKRLE